MSKGRYLKTERPGRTITLFFYVCRYLDTRDSKIPKEERHIRI